MAQTKTMRNGSLASLNLSSRFSVSMRRRWVRISSPFSRNSLISFCDCETTTAMSVSSMKAILRSISARSASLSGALRPLRIGDGGGIEPGAQIGEGGQPARPHFVVHADGGGLVHADDHRLAGLAAREEVGDDILGDLLQAVVAGEQMVLAGEFALQLAFLILVQVGGGD